MTIQEIIEKFIINIRETRWQEWGSTVMQILSVWYARKNNVLVFPTGIIGVLLASYVYFFMSDPPLYADAVLNIYFFVMSVLGWYFWAQKKDTTETFPVSWCSKKELVIGFGLFLIFWVSILLILKNTKSNTPVLDALVTSSAVTAMWWMAKRKIENWHAWIFSNIIAIPLNFYKGFMLFTLMYVLFLIMAYMGYASWKKLILEKKLL